MFFKCIICMNLWCVSGFWVFFGGAEEGGGTWKTNRPNWWRMAHPRGRASSIDNSAPGNNDYILVRIAANRDDGLLSPWPKMHIRLQQSIFSLLEISEAARDMQDQYNVLYSASMPRRCSQIRCTKFFDLHSADWEPFYVEFFQACGKFADDGYDCRIFA